MKKILSILSLIIPLIGSSQITDTGNKVGIGDATPTRKLEIVENSGADGVTLRLTNESWNSHMSTSLEFRTGGLKTVPTSKISSIMNGNGSAGDRLGFFVQNDGINPNVNPLIERLSLLPNGNVGIGITAPFSKLQVEGRASVGTSGVLNMDWTYETNWNGDSSKWAGYVGFNAYRNNDDAKDTYAGKNPYTNKGIFEGSNNGFRWLYRKGINNDSHNTHLLSEYMRLDLNGNLGIGTADTQGFKLGVNGKIIAEEVKVATYNNWSDFVFDKAYHLPTLQEVEQHIQEKGHLKDIPSAEEVKKNGFYLGEMDSKLLQKIEELTLYIIQQEKAHQIQKVINENLEERLRYLEAQL